MPPTEVPIPAGNANAWAELIATQPWCTRHVRASEILEQRQHHVGQGCLWERNMFPVTTVLQQA